MKDHRNGRYRWLVGLAALGALLAFGRDVLATPCRESEVPLSVVDGRDKAVYEYAADKVTKRALDGRNGNPEDIAGADALYVLDLRDKRVYRYERDLSKVVLSRQLFDSGGTLLEEPSGVAVDGDTMWVVDRKNQRLYRYSVAAALTGPAHMSAKQEIGLHKDNGRPEGVAIDGVHLYVVDEQEKRVFRYQRDGAGAVEILKPLRETNDGALGQPSGCALRGDSLFVSDRGKNAIFRYKADGLFAKGNGGVAATSQCHLDPRNGDARGVAPAPAPATAMDSFLEEHTRVRKAVVGEGLKAFTWLPAAAESAGFWAVRLAETCTLVHSSNKALAALPLAGLNLRLFDQNGRAGRALNAGEIAFLNDEKQGPVLQDEDLGFLDNGGSVTNEHGAFITDNKGQPVVRGLQVGKNGFGTVVGDSGFVRVGENLAIVNGVKRQPATGKVVLENGRPVPLSAVEIARDAVQLWESERGNFDPAATASPYCKKNAPGNPECGHYSQLVWRNSTQVGCAIMQCIKQRTSSVVVCQYLPPGNVSGERAY